MLRNEWIIGELLRDPPVSLSPIQPVYIAKFDEKNYFEFKFADPLALDGKTEKDKFARSEGLVPNGINISLKSANIPFSHSFKLSYDEGVGFGKLEFIIDGDAA